MAEKDKKINELNSLEKCKASGKIIKILKYEDSCSNYYIFKFNDGTNDFVMSGTEPKLNSSSPSCIDKLYTFSGGKVPNVGDDIYLIGINPISLILELGKDNYDSNTNLMDCSIQSIGSPSYDEYLWADKCKVNGKIENIQRTFIDKCGFNLGIKIKDGENTYIVGGREYFSGKGITLCLGAGDGWFPIDSTDGKISTQINSGDNFYAILNQKNGTILRYGQNEYNSVDSSIPTCSSAKNEQLQAFTGGLTESKIKQIMDAVETEIVKTYPDISNKQNTNTTGTNNISSGTTSNTKESIVTKPNTTQTQNVSTQGSKIKQDISIVQSGKEEDNYTNSGTNKNIQTTKDLESSTGSIKIENNNTNSGLVQNTELQIQSNETQQNFSPFIFLGGLIILLGVILLTTYKKKISKKQ